jgi:hypothetical protein
MTFGFNDSVLNEWQTFYMYYENIFTRLYQCHAGILYLTDSLYVFINISVFYAECRYTECCYAECCGAALFRQIIIFPQKWDKESHYQTYLKCSRKNLKILFAKSSHLGNKLVCLSLAMLWAINKKIDCLRLSSVKHSSLLFKSEN